MYLRHCYSILLRGDILNIYLLMLVYISLLSVRLELDLQILVGLLHLGHLVLVIVKLFSEIKGLRFLPIQMQGVQYRVSVTIFLWMRGNQFRFARCIIPDWPGWLRWIDFIINFLSWFGIKNGCILSHRRECIR